MKQSKEKKEKERTRKLRLSIKAKTIAMIIAFAAALSGVSMWVCGRVVSNISDELYYADATDLSATIAQIVDGEQVKRVKNAVMEIYYAAENKVGSEDWGSDEFNAYIALFDSVAQSEDFKQLRAQLRKIQDANNVDCCYISAIDPENKKMIYIVDAADDEDACPPGCIDPLFEVNYGLLDDPTIGFPAYETDTEEYGELVTAGSTIYDNEGKPVAYAQTDVSLHEMRYRQIGYVMRLLAYQIVTVAALCVIGSIFVDRVLIRPIKKLSKAADNYCADTESTYRHTFAELTIRTGDEIEALSDSMKQMENDLNDHIKNLLSVNNELAESQSLASEMSILANKDALTGVRNRHAYEAEIAALHGRLTAGKTAAFGLAVIDLNYLKQINDTYGHEAGNEALVMLTKTVCGVFVHSPVFRIGGDEFVVVLENNDYDKHEELLREFGKNVAALAADESLPPQKRISAAIGCAIYDKEIDASAEDVFRRADHAMYEQKRAMKAERKQ